jgi:hypothetical protein
MQPPMSGFVAADRDTAYLLPPSVNEWLPADHLARFVVEVIEQLDLSALTRQYEMKLLKLGHIAVDGTKIEANASKHKALRSPGARTPSRRRPAPRTAIRST